MRNRSGAISMKVVLALLTSLMICMLSATAFSQEYPTKTITAVVGMEAGGIVDVATRMLMEDAKKVIGQDILVENRPGASHMIAGSHVVSSKPDGYTLWGSTDAPFVRMPHMMKLKFDPIAETTPIIFYGVFTHLSSFPRKAPSRHSKTCLPLPRRIPASSLLAFQVSAWCPTWAWQEWRSKPVSRCPMFLLRESRRSLRPCSEAT